MRSSEKSSIRPTTSLGRKSQRQRKKPRNLFPGGSKLQFSCFLLSGGFFRFKIQRRHRIPGNASSRRFIPAAQPSNNTSSAITQGSGQSIALKDAGVSESATQFVWVKENYDDGRLVYEVEFYANGTEYDYDIDQATGRILSSDFDIENYSPAITTAAMGRSYP